MRYPTYRTLTRLFSEEGQLQNITVKAHQLQALNEALRAFLPEVLRSRCRVANLQGNRLVLATEEGSAATKLKFLVPELLAHLKSTEKWSYVRTIEVKVMPTLEAQASAPKIHLAVPEANRESLRLLAENCDFPALKAAIEKLLKHR